MKTIYPTSSSSLSNSPSRSSLNSSSSPLINSSTLSSLNSSSLSVSSTFQWYFCKLHFSNILLSFPFCHPFGWTSSFNFFSMFLEYDFHLYTWFLKQIYICISVSWIGFSINSVYHLNTCFLNRIIIFVYVFLQSDYHSVLVSWIGYITKVNFMCFCF